MKKSLLHLSLYLGISQIIYFIAIYVIFANLAHKSIDFVTFLNFDLNFLIFSLIMFSLSFSIANRAIIILFGIQYFIYGFVSLFLLFIGPDLGFLENQTGILGYTYSNLYWIFQYIAVSTYNLTFSIFLFLQIILKNRKHIVFSISFLVSLLICFLIYFDVLTYEGLFILDDYGAVYREFYTATYYINLINISTILMVWLYYSRGYFVLSDYISSILALYTLVLLLEIYHSFSFVNNLGYYINGQYFNALLNFGIFALWIIRVLYLQSNEARENEYYVLNYDLLQGFVEKPRVNYLNKFVMKIGKRNLVIASSSLFLLISIPVFFYENENAFIKFNILILTISFFVAIIFMLTYIQKRWYNIIGFIFKNRLN